MFVVVGSGLAYGFEKVPISGRRRWNIMNAGVETWIGNQEYEQLLAEYERQIVDVNDPRARLVRKVMDRLIPTSGLMADKQWTIHLIESEQQNAFVLPGGHVFVFAGILPACKNEDGVAVVLAHEMAHSKYRKHSLNWL